MTEIWKDITAYEELYQVSNLGRVRNKKLNVIKSQRRRGKYYLAVDFGKGANRKTYYVHRLVAEAFLPKKEDCDFVNHIDGNGLNNALANLERVSPKENVHHKNKVIQTGKRISKKKLDNLYISKSFTTIEEFYNAIVLIIK